MLNLSDLRKEYSFSALDELEVDKNPFLQFKQWFQVASEGKVLEPNAMHLSTVANGRPRGRIVLLKSVDYGFTFFTNYQSAKGQELQANPAAAITFFWGEVEKQVRIEGLVEKLSASESDEYFGQRPRESQLGAWASAQSSELTSRKQLIDKYFQLLSEFEGEVIQRPAHWGGFRLIPDYFEFWQGGAGRLHDRIVYRKQAISNDWQIARLSP
jgi:pyridoxamine 5'-phosphate oxidase